jgi:hypothetical protein
MYVVVSLVQQFFYVFGLYYVHKFNVGKTVIMWFVF